MNENYDFPTAVHSYFNARNRLSEKRKFLNSDKYEPEFRYKVTVDEVLMQERLCRVEGDMRASRSIQLVCASLRLREEGDNLGDFRSANESLYGSPRDDYVESILSHYKKRVTVESEGLWFEIEQLLSKEINYNHHVIRPSDLTFGMYREFLLRYVVLPSVSRPCISIIEELLDLTGLRLQGWKVRELRGSEHARTYHSSKNISIGRGYIPRTSKAGLRVGVHEVLGHALRGSQETVSEAEGFAIMLEQLTDTKFVMRRSYRYLAAALGWGVLGQPMTFRQVFEIIWRVMIIASEYKYDKARSYAFDECYRAFRGGKPDMAGAVLLKDMVYFDANIRMWETLEGDALSYSQFVDVIEGRRVLLS